MIIPSPVLPVPWLAPLQAGTGQFDVLDAPLLAAHARLMRAPVRRQLGDTAGARALLAEAEVLLAQCASTGIIGDLVPQSTGPWRPPAVAGRSGPI